MNARVDYYLLDQTDPQALAAFCSRLINKAYKAGMRVFVATDSAMQSEAINKRLWTSSDASFIPHALSDSIEAADPLTRVCIGSEVDDPSGFDILVNLQNSEAPKNMQYARVAELVSADEAHKRAARMRFVAWRNAGAEQNWHQIKLN